MDKRLLEVYRANKRLVDRNRKKIEEETFRDIPVVMSKVTGSSHEHPYTARRFSVEVDEPVEAERQRKRIRQLEEEISRAEKEIAAVESFVDEIDDPTDKDIFRCYYIDGDKKPSQKELANTIGYTQGRISQRIKRLIQLIHD